MEIQHLRYFHAVCMLRNFSKAADSCFVTAQGISMAIRRLEDELNCKLFERSSKKEVILTEHAKYLLPYAQKILSLMDSCGEYFHSGMGKEQHLEIGVTFGAMEEFAAEPIAIFRKEYSSNVYLEVNQEYDSQCEMALDEGECEFALIAGNIDDTKYIADKVFSTPYGIVVHQEHPLAKRKTINLKELDNVPLRVFRNSQKTQQLLYNAAEEYGINLNIASLVEHATLTQQHLDKINDVGITTESLWHRFQDANTCFIPFGEPALCWDLSLVRPRNSAFSPAAAMLWQLMLKYSEDMNQR